MVSCNAIKKPVFGTYTGKYKGVVHTYLTLNEDSSYMLRQNIYKGWDTTIGKYRFAGNIFLTTQLKPDYKTESFLHKYKLRGKKLIWISEGDAIQDNLRRE
jgi:hypothetical protein